MTAPVENLVFEGGGMKGIAYAGGVQALEERGIDTGIQRVAGTSAGALMALMMSLRYTADEMRTVLLESDFRSFRDHPDPVRLIARYGFYRGEAFHGWIIDRLTSRGFDAAVTFAQLADHGCRELRVFATDLNTRQLREFSQRATPDTVVADAVRASMSIPLMFSAWQFPNGTPDDHIYVDGGAIMNFPIDAFDEDQLNPATLGLHLTRADDIDTELGYNHLVGFVRDLFDCMLHSQLVDYQHSLARTRRVVAIDDFGYSAVDFTLDRQARERLFQSGYQSVLQHLDEESAA